MWFPYSRLRFQAPRFLRVWGWKRWMALAAGILGLWCIWEAVSWPDVQRLSRSNPKTTAFIRLYQENQARSGRSPAVKQRWVAYSEISDELKIAVLVAEDIDFHSHHGFSIGEIRNALSEAIREGEAPRGASTITQQLAKNLWLSPSRNPLRKLREALLTWHVERALTKRRILELYLNLVEFGGGVYGAEAAAQHYFGKPASQLSRVEAAQLAAGLPRPASWNPNSASRAYRRRVESILRRMAKAEWISRKIVD